MRKIPNHLSMPLNKMTHSNNITLSIIIVNLNTKDYLYECIKSVLQNTFDILYDIFVIDNASIDGSIEMITSNFPQVKLIKKSENIGFAKANNIALRQTNAEYVLLLNSDTKVLANSLNSAISFLHANPNICALSPKILNPNGTVQHPCYIGYPSIVSELSGFPVLGKLLKNYNAFGKYIPADEEIHDIVHATGACLFIRKKALDDVGILDESLIFSFEDADWCLRAKRKKWSLVYFPGSKVIHHGSATLNRVYGNKLNHSILISKHRFFVKYHSRYYVGSLILLVLISSAIKIVVAYMRVLFCGDSREGKGPLMYYKQICRWYLPMLLTTIYRKKTQ